MFQKFDRFQWFWSNGPLYLLQCVLKAVMAYKPLRLFYVQQKKKITHLDIYLFTDIWALHQ